MVKRCCVTKCRGNYDEEKRVKVFRFPRDQSERQSWVQAIPRENIPNSRDTVVCTRHFAGDFVMIMDYGQERPTDPPSIFDNIKPSLVPTPPSKPRPTIIACSSTRKVLPDQLGSLDEKDRIKYQSIHIHPWPATPNHPNNKLAEFGEKCIYLESCNTL